MAPLPRKTPCAAQVALQHCPILHMSKRKSMIPTGFYTVNWLNLLRKAGSNPSGQVAQNTSVLRLRRIGISILLCPICGNEQFSQSAQYCRICGTPAYNFCTREGFWESCHHVNSTNARFCELCGSSTEYANRNILRDWQLDKEDYIRKITQR